MLPGETSPPKSGCIAVPAPMNAMYVAEFGSTGAALMSAFHQFVGGNSGSGPGRGPPSVAAHAVAAVATAPRRTMGASRRWTTTPPNRPGLKARPGATEHTPAEACGSDVYSGVRPGQTGALERAATRPGTIRTPERAELMRLHAAQTPS